MNIAIVGASKLSPLQAEKVHEACFDLIKEFDKDSLVISGGADGVDTIAIQIAKKLGYKFMEIIPEEKTWESFKARNLEIARKCDKIYCISVKTKNAACYHHIPRQKHLKTAGCWTMNQVNMLGKPCKLIEVDCINY